MLTWQLEVIQHIQKIRSPFLDELIKLLNFFDRQEFLFILIPVIWLGFGWKWGMRIFYLLALSYGANAGLKNLFALPRPFHLDPTLGIIFVKGYGFPSGAAQTAILLSGLLLIFWKSRWKWIVAITYTMLLSFSRMYLGVHFPIDILGGWLIGLSFLGLYLLISPRIENFFKNKTPLQSFVINYFFLIALILMTSSKALISICACALGLETGILMFQWINLYRPLPKNKLEFFGRVLVGITGVFVIYNSAQKTLNLQLLVNDFFLFASIGLWISFGALYICDRFRFYGQKKIKRI